MRECLDEGLIQSYTDGELSLEMTEAVATHISACAACAQAVREAENETAIFGEAFVPEMSLSVPTARLRERIDTAIAELQPQTRAVTKSTGSRTLRDWLSSLFTPFAFQPRQAIGFASLAAVVTFAVIFSTLFLRRSGPEYAREAKVAAPIAFNIPDIKAPEKEVLAPITAPESGSVIKASYQPKKSRPRSQESVQERATLVAKNSPASKQPAAPKDTLLPGERSYLTAIASLTTSIESNGETALKPSLRVEYERNLAVVDQAIEVTRRAARNNPNDEDAANFLLAAYQSKVDLLSTVADQARLSASAR